MEGRAITGEDVAEPREAAAADVLRGQVLGAIAGPLTMVVGLFSAPLRDLVGVLQARIDQLEAQGETAGASTLEPASGAEPQSAEPAETPAAEAQPADETNSGSEPQSPEADTD